MRKRSLAFLIWASVGAVACGDGDKGGNGGNPNEQTPTTYTLTVSGSGTGRGSVTGGGLNCSFQGGVATGTCAMAEKAGVTVELVAAPAPDHSFSGWSGACTGTSGCSVTMDQARSVGAGFAAPIPHAQITVFGGGTGKGSIRSVPAGIDCAIAAGKTSGSCTGTFVVGDTVRLTASPDSGQSFTGWSECYGMGACRLVAGQTAGVTAWFTPTPFYVGSYTGAVSITYGAAGTPQRDTSLLKVELNGSQYVQVDLRWLGASGLWSYLDLGCPIGADKLACAADISDIRMVVNLRFTGTEAQGDATVYDMSSGTPEVMLSLQGSWRK